MKKKLTTVDFRGTPEQEAKLLEVIAKYDGAAWMAVTALSEESIAKGGVPVAFPDFTNGKWCAYSVEE